MNDADLERAMDELSDGGGPREGWQDCVLARIEVPPAPRRRARWPLVAAGSGLVAAAAAVALFFALRARPTVPPEVPAAAGRPAFERLDRAMTDAERAEAHEHLREKIRQRDEMGRRLEALKARARKSKREDNDDKAKVVAKCEPADPLCGLE